MDAGRARQFAIWKRLSDAQRWGLVEGAIAFALAAREQRLREQHPEAGEAELRRLRRDEALRRCAQERAARTPVG
jgi:hypothetical protein